MAVGLDRLARERHGRNAVHVVQLVRQALPRRGAAAHVREHGREGRVLLLHAAPCAPAHVHDVAHVVLDDAVHRELNAPPLRVACVVLAKQHDLLARADAVQARELLRHQHAVVAKRHGLARCAVAQAHAARKARGRTRHHDARARLLRGGGGAALAACQYRAALHALHPARARIPKARHHGAHVLLGGVRVHAHGGVVADDGAKLPVDDVPYGVVQAKAHQEQRGAACDAHHRHEQAALVAKQVPERDLPREGQPPPQRAHALQEDAPARLGRARQHEGGRRLAQGGRHREPCGRKRHAHAEAAGRERDARAHGKRQAKARHRVDDAVRAYHDERQHLREHRDAKDGARAGREQRVREVHRRDAGAAVAQRLVRADLLTVVLDHARHRRERHQGRHQEEHGGKHRGYVVHALRVRLVGGRALALRAVEHVDLRPLHGVHLGLGGVCLALRLLKLCLGIRLKSLEALLCRRVRRAAHALCHGLHATLVRGRPALEPARAADGKVRLRVRHVLRKRGVRHVHVLPYGAVA